MNRSIAVAGLLVVVSLGGACNSANSPVQTNANSNQNLNANSAPTNTGVLTNNNGNDNTAGVRPINANNSNHNDNKKPGNTNN
jgi:hypothetical protein